MKALSIYQPFAEMIRLGEKRIENRNWQTAVRGPLLIHAARSLADWVPDFHPGKYPDAAFGALVAIADLVDCLHYSERFDARYPWIASHEHAHGPWMFVLDNVRSLPAPIPFRGMPGFFEVGDIHVPAPEKTNRSAA